MKDINDKDFITINTLDGKKGAELVSKFEIQGLGDYVIYKLDNKYYGAKYEIIENQTNLITDLNAEEKEILNELFENLGVK